MFQSINQSIVHMFERIFTEIIRLSENLSFDLLFQQIGSLFFKVFANKVLK